MQRFRITVNDGKPGRLIVFDTGMMLLRWREAPMTEMKGSTSIDIRPEDYADFEWLGCEFIREDDGNYSCQNLVHIGFARVPENGSKHVIEKFIGWVSDELLPVRETSFMNFTVRKLENNEGISLPHPFE